MLQTYAQQNAVTQVRISPKPKTIGEVAAGFFDFESNPNFYYPGVMLNHRESYECDYFPIAEDVIHANPRVKTVGITLDNYIKRERDDGSFQDIVVKDILKLEDSGVIFFPKFSQWYEEISFGVNPISHIRKYLDNMSEGGGIILYDVENDSILRQMANLESLLCKGFGNENVLKINSRKSGTTYFVRKGPDYVGL